MVHIEPSTVFETELVEKRNEYKRKKQRRHHVSRKLTAMREENTRLRHEIMEQKARRSLTSKLQYLKTQLEQKQMELEHSKNRLCLLPLEGETNDECKSCSSEKGVVALEQAPSSKSLRVSDRSSSSASSSSSSSSSSGKEPQDCYQIDENGNSFSLTSFESLNGSCSSLSSHFSRDSSLNKQLSQVSIITDDESLICQQQKPPIFHALFQTTLSRMRQRRKRVETV